MDVEELLTRAWEAVQKAGIPEPLQEFAFKEALTYLSGPTPAAGRKSDIEDVVKGGSEVESDGDKSANKNAPADHSDPFAKFAHESSVAVEDLERVFYIAEGVPHMNGPRAKFANNAADQAKVVAVALTAAYDFMLDQTPISDDVVKAEALRLKIDLGGNWARTMGSLNGASWIGPARQKQFKTTNSAADALQKLVTSILRTSAE